MGAFGTAASGYFTDRLGRSRSCGALGILRCERAVCLRSRVDARRQVEHVAPGGGVALVHGDGRGHVHVHEHGARRVLPAPQPLPGSTYFGPCVAVGRATSGWTTSLNLRIKHGQGWNLGRVDPVADDPYWCIISRTLKEHQRERVPGSLSSRQSGQMTMALSTPLAWGSTSALFTLAQNLIGFGLGAQVAPSAVSDTSGHPWLFLINPVSS